jgi:hypothetical protein
MQRILGFPRASFQPNEDSARPLAVIVGGGGSEKTNGLVFAVDTGVAQGLEDGLCCPASLNTMQDFSIATLAFEPSFSCRENELVFQIVADYRLHENGDGEHESTAYYLRTGAAAWRFVCFRLQDGQSHAEAVKDLKNRLTAAGVANTDVSTFIKAHLLHELCPAVMQLPVKVLIALLPLCRRKQDMAYYTDGVSHVAVCRLVAGIQAERIAATRVRDLVAELLGQAEKAERRAWEVVVSYHRRLADSALQAALRNSLWLRERLGRLLANCQEEQVPAAPANGGSRKREGKKGRPVN